MAFEFFEAWKSRNLLALLPFQGDPAATCETNKGFRVGGLAGWSRWTLVNAAARPTPRPRAG